MVKTKTPERWVTLPEYHQALVHDRIQSFLAALSMDYGKDVYGIVPKASGYRLITQDGDEYIYPLE